MRAPILLAVLLVVAAVSAGCTDKLSFNSGGTIDAPSFSLSPEAGDAETVFSVDAGALGDKHNITWDFGDGTTAYGRTAQHAYGFTNGVMTVTLIATDATGKQGIATRTLTLGTGENAEPAATVRAKSNWVEMRQPVNLSAIVRDADEDPIRHLWTYTVLEGGAAGGDGHAHDHGGGGGASGASGASSTMQGQEFVIDGDGPAVQAIFDAPGKYAVKLRASDPKGGEAIAEVVVDVSRDIPEPRHQVSFSGTLAAGTGASGVGENAWDQGAPDANVDVARHAYTLRYPATTYVLLAWNDTSGQGLADLDLELRDGAGNVVFESATRTANVPPAPAGTVEMNLTKQPPGDYTVVVHAYSGVQVAYTVQVVAALELTPELVAATEGQ